MFIPRDLSSLANALGGLPILGCSDGSPAADAGLRYGDIILSGDGRPVPSWSELLAVCARASAPIALRVSRAGSELSLAMRPPRSRTPRGVLGDPSPLSTWLGHPSELDAARAAALDLC